MTASSNGTAADDRITVHRGVVAWPPIRSQVERLAADLRAHWRLVAAANPLARGAALAATHVALRLAATPAAAAADRCLRRVALDTSIPALAAAGLPHTRELMDAALLHDFNAVTVAPGAERLQ